MKLTYCPECSTPLKKISDTKYVCTNSHTYWNNPRVTATVILLKDGQVLFSKRALEPHKGKYDTPGGFAEYGESPSAAIKRELKEETGLVADDCTLIDWGSHIYEENVSTCDFIFLVTKWHGTIQAADDSAALVWKPIDFIVSPNFAWSYPGLVKKLKAYHNKAADGELPRS
jgi:ADP-ribose pyrophosphatase YjhB (NUDIX family)